MNLYFSIRTLSSASDYASFMHVLGIPSVDFSYGFREVHQEPKLLFISALIYLTLNSVCRTL